MAKYCKKPVVIDAWLPPAENDMSTREIPAWVIDAIKSRVIIAEDNGKFSVKTAEGLLTASQGDWILRGIKGEIYPCKPDIFLATYDPVEP